MAALTVYFDDSGTHNESPITVIGGWIAPIQQWKKFIKEWNKAKAEYGFGELHTANFMFNNKNSEFADKDEWNDAKKKIVLQRLESIILQRVSHGFCLRVVKKDHSELIPQELKKTVGNFPYTYALRGAIGFMENWRKKIGITEPTEYIFDTMTKGAAKTEINRVFEEAIQMENTLHKYGIYKGWHSFRDSEEILPLQAADMLAWLSLRAYMYEHNRSSMPQFAIETWNRLLLSKKLYAKAQTRENLREFMSKNPKPFVQLPDDWNTNAAKKKKGKAQSHAV